MTRQGEIDGMGRGGAGGREGGRRKAKEELRLGGGAPKSKKAEVTLSLVLAVKAGEVAETVEVLACLPCLLT